VCHGFAAFHKETRDTQAGVMGFNSEPMTHKCVSWVYDEKVLRFFIARNNSY